MAYQIAFNMYESATQQFLSRQGLPAPVHSPAETKLQSKVAGGPTKYREAEKAA